MGVDLTHAYEFKDGVALPCGKIQLNGCLEHLLRNSVEPGHTGMGKIQACRSVVPVGHIALRCLYALPCAFALRAGSSTHALRAGCPALRACCSGLPSGNCLCDTLRACNSTWPLAWLRFFVAGRPCRSSLPSGHVAQLCGCRGCCSVLPSGMLRRYTRRCPPGELWLCPQGTLLCLAPRPLRCRC